MDDTPSNDTELIGDWEEAITAARNNEKSWRDEAEKSVDTYRGEHESQSRHFNLHHSNIEIVVPSLYNSTPIPDVRRRFGDDDPVARTVAEVIERALSYCADAYSFDEVEYLAVYDAETAGRGVTRVRYMPDSDGEKVYSQKLTTELVPWDRFIRGPAVAWSDVPYIAFEHYLPREEVEKLNPKLVDKIPFVYSAEGCDESENHKEDEEIPKQFQRARVYEIWDKRSRQVLFICLEYKQEVILRQDDPLGLDGFYPVARPIYSVSPVGSLVPVCPMSIYRALLEELNDVTFRIGKLVKQLRPRGAYAGTLDLKALVEAADGEIVPLTETSPNLAEGAVDVNKWIAWFPLEPTVLALRELLSQREALLQTIYQVTGMSDLMRGSNDPRATATAENLKAQFGSVRMKAKQAAVAMHARDTFRIKAEIIAKHFEWPILSEMTNIKLLPQAEKQMLMQMAQMNPQAAQQIAQQKPELIEQMQAPSVEEVMEVLRSGMMSYRIDIETNSTIRSDLQRRQEEMAKFLQGTAQYIQAMGPAVKEGIIPAGPAVKVYTAFARDFQLGRIAEDALDKLADNADNMKPPPGEDAAGAAAAKAEGDVKAAQLVAQSDEKIKMAEMQAKVQIEQAKIASNEKIKQLDAQLKAAELQLRQMEAQLEDSRERQNNAAVLQQKREDSIQQAVVQQRTAQMQDAREGENMRMQHERETQSMRMQDARQGEANRMKRAQVQTKRR